MDNIEVKKFTNKKGDEIPYIEISNGNKFPQRFGFVKARKILENADAIKKILEQSGNSPVSG